MSYFDIYVLSSQRSEEVAIRFLNQFIPQREQSAEDYLFPQFAAEPKTVLTSAIEAIHYCVVNPFEQQNFYFRNLSTGPPHAMLFFTSDGELILGLSVIENEQDWFEQLKEFAESNIGYIDSESPPKLPAEAFRKYAVTIET